MSVLREFKEAIEVQQRKQDEAYDEQISLPEDERVAKGVTMSNLKVKFDFFDAPPNNWCPELEYPLKFIQKAHIFCDNNISKFREGTQVVLSNRSFRFKMEIVEDSNDHFILQPNDFDVKECYIDSENYETTHWEINEVKTALTLKLLSATAGNLENDPVRLKKIEKLLNGQLTNKELNKIDYLKLNPSQNEAVNCSIQSSEFHLIQGPPGTGKTETIAHITNVLVSEGLNVFITAPTHTAINNCLSAIGTRIKDQTKVVKIGEKYQAAEILNNEFVTRLRRLPKEKYPANKYVSKNGIAIGATPYSLCYPASKRLNNWEFDVAIVDEAAQMSIPLAVSVMSKSNKFIFVGDHQQLDPIMPADTDISMFSESIFSRLVRLYPKDITLLRVSYRLNEDLIRLPNELFYQNKLSSAIQKNDNETPFSSGKYSNVLNHLDSKVLYLHHEFDSSGRSPYEAAIVTQMVKDLISNGIKMREIAILTPYRAQVREIKKQLEREVKGFDSSVLFVDTVDRMQGQERDYIFYSMSNSHPLESKRRLDFFYSPNRLNVAITRAIKKCIVIANYKVFDIIEEELTELPEYERLKPSLEIFKEYRNLSSVVQEIKEEDDW